MFVATLRIVDNLWSAPAAAGRRLPANGRRGTIPRGARPAMRPERPMPSDFIRRWSAVRRGGAGGCAAGNVAKCCLFHGPGESARPRFVRMNLSLAAAGGSGRKAMHSPRADCRRREIWWTHQDLNLGPLACEASALTGLSYASTVGLGLLRRLAGVTRCGRRPLCTRAGWYRRGPRCAPGPWRTSPRRSSARPPGSARVLPVICGGLPE